MYFLAVVVVALAGAGASTVDRHMKLLADIDNHIDSKVPKPPMKNFLTLSRRPPRVVSLSPGEALELTCDAVASPAPSIHWFKNDAPVYEYGSASSWAVPGGAWSLARVSSSLVVGGRAGGRAGGAWYSCVASAGPRTQRAHTSVYTTGDGVVDDSERSKLVPLAPKILVTYKVYVDTIGNDVVLPCQVKGHPRPTVTWRDNDGNIVKKTSRMEVSRSGSLRLRSVSWSDLGAWSCTARNRHGTDTKETFLYPAQPSDTDDKTNEHEVNTSS